MLYFYFVTEALINFYNLPNYDKNIYHYQNLKKKKNQIRVYLICLQMSFSIMKLKLSLNTRNCVYLGAILGLVIFKLMFSTSSLQIDKLMILGQGKFIK